MTLPAPRGETSCEIPRGHRFQLAEPRLIQCNAHISQFLSQTLMLRQGAGDESPELCGVIKFAQVTEFVDDDVIAKMRGEQRELVVEVEIPRVRTAPPSGALVLDSDSVPLESIKLIEMREPFRHKRRRFCFMLREMPLPILYESPARKLAEILYLVQHPF